MTSAAIAKTSPLTAALVELLFHEVLGRVADELLREALLRALRPAAVASAQEVARSLGLRPSVDAGHPTLARLAVDRTPRLVGVNDETRRAIRQVLLDVASEGGSLEDQQRAVRRVFAHASRARAQTIARTEVGTFWHSAGRAQALELGAMSHVWLATRDLRVRDAHAIADGQCQPAGQPFFVGGEPLMHPHDPNGSPGNVINCRCTEVFQPGRCEGRSFAASQRGWLWKSQMAQIAPWERLTMHQLRGQFTRQRDAIILWLARVGGAA